jgi:hypothetical protein
MVPRAPERTCQNHRGEPEGRVEKRHGHQPGYLSRQRSSALLVDVDPQANATTGISIGMRSKHNGIMRCLDNPARRSFSHRPSTLQILPSRRGARGAE